MQVASVQARKRQIKRLLHIGDPRQIHLPQAFNLIDSLPRGALRNTTYNLSSERRVPYQELGIRLDPCFLRFGVFRRSAKPLTPLLIPACFCSKIRAGGLL